MPPTSPACGNATRVERGGYFPNVRDARYPELSQVSAQLTCLRVGSCPAFLSEPLSVGRTQPHPSRLSRGECCLGALADHLSLTLCHGSHDVQHHAIGRGYVAGPDLYAAFQQSADEVHVTGETIEFGDYERRLVSLCVREGYSELRSVFTFAALHLGESRNRLTSDKGANGSLLRS